MPLALPLDLLHWLRDNGERLKPPVNSFCLHSGTDFFVMVVGGPNARADYHVNETEVLECLKKSKDGISYAIFDRTGMVLSA